MHLRSTIRNQPPLRLISRASPIARSIIRGSIQVQRPVNLASLHGDIAGRNVYVEYTIGKRITIGHPVPCECGSVDCDSPGRVVSVVSVLERRILGEIIESGTSGVVVRMRIGLGHGGVDLESVQEGAVVHGDGVARAVLGANLGANLVCYFVVAAGEGDLVHAGVGVGGERTGIIGVGLDGGAAVIVPCGNTDVEIKSVGGSDGVGEGTVPGVVGVDGDSHIRAVGDSGLDSGGAEESMADTAIDGDPTVGYKLGVTLGVVDAAARVDGLHAVGGGQAAVGSGEDVSVAAVKVLGVVDSPGEVRGGHVLMTPFVSGHHHGHGVVDDSLGTVGEFVVTHGLVEVSHGVTSLDSCAKL